MLKKIILLAFAACLLGISNAPVYAYTCEKDNQIGISDSEFCCCTPIAGSADEYNCSPKSSKCSAGEIPVGKKIQDQNNPENKVKVCPCRLKVS